MKIAIHHQRGSYSQSWIDYCIKNNISYKIVNCYESDIISKLGDCDALMWHHSHSDPKDVLFAKELLFSVEAAGKLVYPDSRSTWHFDDKLGQKYLMEAMGLPLVPAYAFYDKTEALKWVENAEFPLVFKLRGGAGGRNVRLLRSRQQARRIIKKAFGRGIRQYDAIGGIKDKIRRYRLGLSPAKEVIKAFLHLVYPIRLEKSKGRDKGYVYFQKFIPGCDTDIRVQLVGDRSWAMIRKVRENDFRASGSGNIDFDMSKVPMDAIELSVMVARKLGMQSLAIDLLPYNGGYGIVEISYAFGIDEEELEFGYCDGNLIWHPGHINPFGWMIDDLIKKYNNG
ncbi:MAG: hypothetical protein V1775_07455 [Bacteroidota bacterium]